MRIKKVRAGAFGPLCGEELELADGMTVITGPNESGKSTWHAAIYAALCGMRRGRGAPVTADREFRARHQPWAGDDWQVDALVELDDNRTVELTHDLDTLVDCHATDAVLGGDLTADILFEGTPDGSRWLGLNRRTFFAVACVRQAQILRVIEDAKALQDDLQRAAATAGADQSAARAIELIDGAHRDRVGFDRANSTGPLRRAKQRVAQAHAEQQRVQDLHSRWQADLEQLAELRARAADTTGCLRVAEAAQAAAELAVAEQRLARVEELARRNPIPPPEPIHPGISDAVNGALAAWEHRPEPEVPSGEDAAELRARLDALAGSVPARPAAPDVVISRSPTLDGAGAPATSEHLPSADPESTRHPGATPNGRLRNSVPAVALLGLGAGLLVAGIVLAVLGPLVAGAAVAGAGAVAMVTGGVLALARGRAEVSVAVQPDLAEMEARWKLSEEACRMEQRTGLERRLHERIATEQRYAAEQARVAEAVEALRSAARDCGFAGDRLRQSPDVLAATLKAWRSSEDSAAHRAARARQEWGELQALLAGSTPEQLQGQLAKLAEVAAELAEGVDAHRLTAWAWQGDPDRQVARLRSEANLAGQELAALERELEVRTQGVCSAAEAAEHTAAAQAELDRVTSLSGDLSIARDLLVAAQVRVHRSLAPQLAEALRPRLREVTAGRYTDVRVDPEALEVRVMTPDGRWRAATQLSQGTTEQVYLLLRIALADILTAPGTSCPLLLDDVLVQSDPQRSRALLELLLAESERRQVILFSQEDDVTTWARRRLAGRVHPDMPGRHRHIELHSPAGPRPSAAGGSPEGSAWRHAAPAVEGFPVGASPRHEQQPQHHEAQPDEQRLTHLAAGQRQRGP
jgi:recombinational DNA repair ATPase RecF